MARTNVTFQVLDGIDKGRVFRELSLPFTIGREEGNLLRLNDERVSRFHAKILLDSDDVILTDMESTNGTRVNGTVVQIRRLRYGDRVGVGRSLLLYGSNEEIASRMASLSITGSKALEPSASGEGTVAVPSTRGQSTVAGQGDANVDFDLNVDDSVRSTPDALFIGNKALPPLPQKMNASQASRFAEILDFLHQGLIQATENIQAKEDGAEVHIGYQDWQRIQAVQMLLARYQRLIAEPETRE